MATNMQIFVVLQETLPELWFKFPKMRICTLIWRIFAEPVTYGIVVFAWCAFFGN